MLSAEKSEDVLSRWRWLSKPASPTRATELVFAKIEVLMKRSWGLETRTKRLTEAQRYVMPRESGWGSTVEHALGSTGAPSCLSAIDSTTGTLPTLRGWIPLLAWSECWVGRRSQLVISSG